MEDVPNPCSWIGRASTRPQARASSSPWTSLATLEHSWHDLDIRLVKREDAIWVDHHTDAEDYPQSVEQPWVLLVQSPLTVNESCVRFLTSHCHLLTKTSIAKACISLWARCWCRSCFRRFGTSGTGMGELALNIKCSYIMLEVSSYVTSLYREPLHKLSTIHVSLGRLIDLRQRSGWRICRILDMTRRYYVPWKAHNLLRTCGPGTSFAWRRGSNWTLTRWFSLEA